LSGKAKYTVASLLVILAFLVVWDYLFWSGRFPPNCYIEKVQVSSYSKYEALVLIKSLEIDKAVTHPISLYFDGKWTDFAPSELGIYISPRRTVTNSNKYVYRSNYLLDLFKRVLDSYKKQTVPFALEVDRDTYKAFLEGLANETDVASREATFTLVDEKNYKITKERFGKAINITSSLANLRNVLYRDERRATIEVSIIQPRVYAKSLVKNPPKYLLSEYITYYGSHDSPNRVHNIKLASSRTNNYILNSGEAMSLLDLLGDFNRDSGYKEAFVLYNGELEPQYGGGSCQIASTLYNAALLAGLEIVERYNHGIYFTIYPLGRDASIYAGGRDLKIGNNTHHPIYIKAYATDKKLTYRIYGTPTAKKVSFSRPMIFFEGERFIPYNVMTDEAKIKINQALLSGKPYYTYVKVITEQAGYLTEKTIVSHYKMTGDRENVKIVRPEPE